VARNTPRQRINQIFQGQPTDRIPHLELWLPSGLTGGQPPDLPGTIGERKKLAAFVQTYGIDAVVLAPQVERLADGELQRWREAIGWWQTETEFSVWLLASGGFSQLLNRGGKDWLLLIAARPEEARQRLAAQYRQLAESIQPLLDAGPDGLLIGDDLAGSGGLLAAPEFLEGGVFAPLRQLVELGNERQIPAVLHSDGESEQLPELAAAAGFQGLHGMQLRSVATLAAWRKRHPGLCLLGGLELPAVLNPDGGRLRAELEPLLALAIGGGMVVGTSSGLTEAVNRERLRELAWYIMNYRGD